MEINNSKVVKAVVYQKGAFLTRHYPYENIFSCAGDYLYAGQENTWTIYRIFQFMDSGFHSSYRIMLEKIHRNYPEAQIWCCSLMATYISENREFRFPPCYAGVHIEDFNTSAENAEEKV